MQLPRRLILFVALMLASTAAAPEFNRNRVHLFLYSSTNTPDAKTAFLDFRDLMTDKLPRLASDIGQVALSDDFNRLAKLSLWPVPALAGSGIASPRELIPNLDAQRKYRTANDALMLLTGRVKRLSGEELAIRSSFFLGDLGQPYGTESIDLELRFSDTTYDTTNDSHSVAVLYALALELLPDCSRRADVYLLLSQADLRSTAVSKENAELGQSLKEMVGSAITAANAACGSQ